jgi:iron complex transport system substrate-binding protein
MKTFTFGHYLDFSAPWLMAAVLVLLLNIPALAGTDLTDMAGRRVHIKGKVNRLVTTFKPASLMAYCLGLAPKMVGIDTSSKRNPLLKAVYPETCNLTGVGRKTTGINLETLVGLKPDLVILYAQKDGIQTAQRLERLNIPSLIIVPESFDSIKTTLAVMGNATGRKEQARIVAGQMDQVLDLVAKRLKGLDPKEKKTAYFAASMDLFSTATGSMLQHSIFDRAGLTNVAGSLTGYFQKISPEQFIQWNPDILVFSKYTPKTELVHLRGSHLSGTRAVTSKNVFRSPSSLAPWDFPSPMAALASLWLAQKAYPQRFSDLDTMKIIDRFHFLLFNKGFTAMGGELDDRVNF